MKILANISITIYICLLFGNVAYSQNIKDYFFPSDEYNNVTYRSYEYNRSIYYYNKDTHYETMDIKLVDRKIASASEYKMKFTDTEVHVFSISFYSAIYDDEKFDLNPPLIVLKMPSNNSIHWEYNDEWGQKVKNKVSWTEIYYNGDYRKAIKLEKEYLEMPDSIIIEYYVKGIGLFKTDFHDLATNKISEFERFNYIKNEKSK